MYCRKCGEALYPQLKQDWDQILGLSETDIQSVYYFCPDCEWIFVYEDKGNGDFHEIEDFEA